MENVKPKYRISGIEASFMVFVAMVGDAISLIPVIGNIVAMVFVGGALAVWFAIDGVGFFSAKKLATWATSLLAEAIPAVSVLPMYTIGTVLMIWIVRTEDKTGIKVPVGKKPSKGLINKAKLNKFGRIATMEPSKKRRLVERAQNIRRIREERERFEAPKERPIMQDINPKPINPS